MPSSDLNKIIHQITYSNVSNRLSFFNELVLKDKIFVLMSLTKHVKLQLLNSMPIDDIVSLLESLDPDDVTDIVQLFNKNKSSKIINKLSDNLKKSVQFLSKFDPKTAGGLTSLNYIQINIATKLFSVAEKVKLHEQRTGKVPIIILTKENIVKGYLPEYQLILGSRSDVAGKYIKKIGIINGNAKYNEVINLFETHLHDKVVVIDPNKKIIGIIYSDDVIKLLKTQNSLDLYDFAGVRKEESIYFTSLEKVKSRYKWLIINLGTAFLASFIVRYFDQTIAKYVLLAVYMPIVAGMGGNAGTQTLAVMVRGIALDQLTIKNSWYVLKEELGAGFINGFINAILVFVIVVIFNQDFKLGMILGIAMIANLLVSSFFGTIVPLIMRKLGRDPASSATVFITTATDVLGFFIFLGLATLILF